MALCNALVNLPKDCGDNNLGAIKRALIADYLDVTAKTVTSASNPDTDGNVTAITMAIGTKFNEFSFPKDTSMFGQDLVVDLVADTHSWNQTVELGFRRIDLRKRNAISLLVEGRRDLIVIVQDNNDDYWMLGSDQGMRMTANPMTVNNTRAAGQSLPITLSSENERHMLYKVDASIIAALLVVAD